ncbi:pyridoxal phosphate-dependent aminotransferase [Ensifer sp. ENS05]|uniref:pyridoxal phosphate-dependent aminotransferase n=1 Tax=Ensifer sp. ENS05 TaxID=2769277 RepID=UPI001FF02EBF|nr:pyridoxal phosphate-dependent aminotransferase [Ensifer sp. ENS05]
MFEKATRLFGDDPAVIHLEVGRPDFDTPEHIKAAAKEALDAGKVHYSDFAGELDLRLAIVDHVKENNALDITPGHVLVTNGLTHASFAVMLAAIDPGDEVILLEPYYPQVINKVQLAGGSVVLVPLNSDDGFSIDARRIEAAITPKTRMVCVVNPNNPTGRVYTRAELEAVADIAIRHDLLVCSDEVYEKIRFDGVEHISIASLPGMAERTLTLFAFTKAYAMDGWRLGYLIADPKFMPALMKITMNDVSHVNTFIQAGGVAALRGDQSTAQAMVEEDKRRRDLVCRRLNALPGIKCRVPESSIYVFPDIRGTGYKSQELTDLLLERAKVVVESGAFYGPSGEGYLRFCIGSESYERIEEAMDRLDLFFRRNDRSEDLADAS